MDSWVQRVTLVMGIWFISNGPAGLLIGGLTFGVPAHPAPMVMVAGFVPVCVNGWHALLHFVTGIALVLSARSRRSAQQVSVVVAAIYMAFAIAGLADGGRVLIGLFAIDTFGSVVHLLEAVILLAGVATELLRQQRTSQPSPEARVRPSKEC